MAGGTKGTVDFVGYEVGQPGAPAPSAGYRGLLDFVGFPVGMSGGGGAAAPPMRLLMGVGT